MHGIWTRVLWAMESASRVEGGFFFGARSSAVMKDKAVAIGREHKRDIQCHRIVEGLLHPVTEAVVIVLRLDDGDGDIRFVVKDVVGALGFAARDELPPNNDATLGEINLLADLHHPIPARAFHCGANELGADVAFAQVFLIHAVICLFHAQAPSAFP